jgi:hypothetical protein
VLSETLGDSLTNATRSSGDNSDFAHEYSSVLISFHYREADRRVNSSSRPGAVGPPVLEIIASGRDAKAQTQTYRTVAVGSCEGEHASIEFEAFLRCTE